MTTADFSERRLATVHRTLVAERAGLARVDYQARLVYTVGLLICNDAGVFTRPALMAALNDPSIVQVARAQMRKAARA